MISLKNTEANEGEFFGHWHGKDWRQEKQSTEDEMVGWHHQLNEHDFEQALGVGDGQGSLMCCSPWDHKESDMTEQLNWTDEAYGDKWSSFTGKNFLFYNLIFFLVQNTCSASLRNLVKPIVAFKYFGKEKPYLTCTKSWNSLSWTLISSFLCVLLACLKNPCLIVLWL